MKAYFVASGVTDSQHLNTWTDRLAPTLAMAMTMDLVLSFVCSDSIQATPYAACLFFLDNPPKLQAGYWRIKLGMSRGSMNGRCYRRILAWHFCLN